MEQFHQNINETDNNNWAKCLNIVKDVSYLDLNRLCHYYSAILALYHPESDRK